MKSVVIIPARYASERLPGKPLLKQTGKYLIQHVYERTVQAQRPEAVIVATDDPRIHDAVESFGGRAAMTSPDHRSGTDRIAEVAESLDAEIIVNVQGDEPEIDPAMIDLLVELLEGSDAEMSTLAVASTDPELARSASVVKLVFDRNGYALYFSRSPIPGSKELDDRLTAGQHTFYVHPGLYGYRRDFLLKYSSLPPSTLEQTEALEQLRALDNGYRIKVGVVDHLAVGIDTPEEYQAFVERIANDTT